MAEDLPTIESPASGQAVSVINDRKFLISEVDYWFDGSQYVVRSREFDCLAEGGTLQEALDHFLVSVLDFAETLVHLEEHGAASEREVEMRERLSDRLSRIYLAQRRTPRRGLLKRRRSEELRPKVLA